MTPSESPPPPTAPAARQQSADGAEAGGSEVAVDVLVIGGGPAGTTAATFLARRGWKVTLLEKDVHPRFHIGESLLPMNLPILERLGVLEQVKQIGVHKPGADFPMRGDRDSINVFRFDRALDPKFGYAYQVKRAEFDALLFDNALANGVDARQQVKVEQVEFGADGRPARVHARDAGGNALAFRPRYLVDASGRDTFLGSKLKLKKKNPAHQSAAIFSHFSGVTRREGEEAGNITVERFAHGWMWLIPLTGDVMSVGAVCFPDYLKTRSGDNESFLMQTLRDTPSVWARMGNAQRIAPVHATGNYSYTCTRMHGPGWVMAGPTACDLALGVLEGADYQEFTLQLIPGDLLLLSTDGVSDAWMPWPISPQRTAWRAITCSPRSGGRPVAGPACSPGCRSPRSPRWRPVSHRNGAGSSRADARWRCAPR